MATNWENIDLFVYPSLSINDLRKKGLFMWKCFSTISSKWLAFGLLLNIDNIFDTNLYRARTAY